ncbi:MAG: hypothetical protein JSV43_02380 [Methanobacteriota archaeon]|nr:MAG: hypothetical protein JSV43_02380 [Euryarchaeota archaeon]
MEKRGEMLLFIFIAFVIPILLILVDVFLITDILLTILALVWMGFALIVLVPSVKKE